MTDRNFVWRLATPINRRRTLGVAPRVRCYESTFWNPSWTLAAGSIQTTNIVDLTTTAEAIGFGAPLSPETRQAQIEPRLIGFGEPVEGCATCRTLDVAYSYRLGVILTNSRVLQNPIFGGYGAVAAYLPAKGIAVAMATTFAEEGFGEEGNYLHARASSALLSQNGCYLAPEQVPQARA